jgi:glycosyltransferase involved in cell wall biosynthesis
MKLGIDISRAFVKEITGTEKYSYQLIKRLKLMELEDHQIFLYARKDSKIDFDLPKNFFVKKIAYNKCWTQVGLSLEIRKNPVDVFFTPSHSIPFIHPKNSIVTIHGLEFKYFPKCYSAKERLFLELNTLLSIKWSKKIIVPSENTKKDLMKFYRVNPEKIKVVYHGVRSIKYQVSSIKHSNKKTFNILFIGRLEKRKNLVNLIRAFDISKKSYKLQAISYKLVLAGKEGFGFEDIKKAILESPYKNDIILTGYVSKLEKEKLYNSADIFVAPSLYEGFGLPILEAMSYGVPVICSNNSSLPEIAGNAGLLVDPNNIEKIAKTIKRVLDNADFREEMIKRGFKNAKKFSWEKCARETMDVLLDY